MLIAALDKNKLKQAIPLKFAETTKKINVNSFVVIILTHHVLAVEGTETLKKV